MKITITHLLCFVLLILPLSWAEDSKKKEKKTESDPVWSQPKPRRLFARQKISSSKDHRTPKHKSNLSAPLRRCGRMTENCSARVPCCDPCASCRCRLFNTICHCWRTNKSCRNRT
ncbi:agouti-signaling protein 2b [Cynoglossus semilaevis]|uniref:Agouti-signaling protein-like n=1 Tax=Cynoglossus semilaevis TaxID=244447 RepID=A0A3P8WJF6_CYNSE|nr:agouti-signaling protein-like [Cynoglossus semilaevis]XP_008332334.1 agouti-signaling protein-like [Cynoglossus semilaevis]XP_016897927.1 agouti-signaling protein-like [Cynoglossus semilaevis]